MHAQAVGRLENMVGWYHSHPGYGCWLSGIDVSTQSIQQQYQEPFLAIVVDPHRTIAAGKVEIGAFRTYPEVSIPSLCTQASYITPGLAVQLLCRQTSVALACCGHGTHLEENLGPDTC